MDQIVYLGLAIAIIMLLYLSISDYRKKYSSNAVNLSTTGTKIDWEEKREASIVWTNFNVPESEIVNLGMGIHFLEISKEDRQFISEVVADNHP